MGFGRVKLVSKTAVENESFCTKPKIQNFSCVPLQFKLD
jgi:hypothetical protein